MERHPVNIDKMRSIDSKIQRISISYFKSRGSGINLTMTEVIHLDPWWNPAVEDQASDRVIALDKHKPLQ